MAKSKDGLLCLEKGDRFVLVGNLLGDEYPDPAALRAMALPMVRVVMDERQRIHPLDATVVEVLNGRVIVQEE